jgi:hypothetical protein
MHNQRARLLRIAFIVGAAADAVALVGMRFHPSPAVCGASTSGPPSIYSPCGWALR